MSLVALSALFAVHAAATHAQSGVCVTDSRPVDEALARIRRAVDPCGESPQLLELLAQLDRCPQNSYRICASTDIDRNIFDRPLSSSDAAPVATITWNPTLQSALENAQQGNPQAEVRRDPTASLLHELAHAAQECAGLNPGEHELEAVRIENIYRRAVGLSQRRGYGELALPPQMVRLCGADNCSCAVPMEVSSTIGASMAESNTAIPFAAQPRQRIGDRPE